MRFLYNLLFPFAFLAFLPDMLIKLIRRSGWKKTFSERFGIYSKSRIAELREWQGATWLHAVSVGETNLTLSLLKRWCELEPNRKFILSTTTTTAQEIARTKSPANVKVIFCPLDYFLIVRRVLNLLKPSMIVIFETELWPELITAAKKRGICLKLANTRISDHSFPGYRRFRFIFAPLLSSFETICAQTELDRTRLLEIAPAISKNVIVCGNIKFDQIPPQGNGFDFSEIFGTKNIKTLIAASTHQPEENLILNSFVELKKQFPYIRLVLVPRHAERGNELEKLLNDKNLSYHRRSNHSGLETDFDVLLADTTGELGRMIKGADIVIMGKTLAGNREGQNIIEPAIMGKPIVCGRELTNFRQALDLLVRNHAVYRIKNDSELTGALARLIQDTDYAASMGKLASETMAQSKGASERILSYLRK